MISSFGYLYYKRTEVPFSDRKYYFEGLCGARCNVTVEYRLRPPSVHFNKLHASIFGPAFLGVIGSNWFRTAEAFGHNAR